MDFSEQNLRIQEMYEKSLLQKQELKNVVDTVVEKAIEKKKHKTKYHRICKKDVKT